VNIVTRRTAQIEASLAFTVSSGDDYMQPLDGGGHERGRRMMAKSEVASDADQTNVASLFPIAWITGGEIPAVLKGAELAVKGGEKLVEWIKSEWPLLVQVLDSRLDGESFVVKFKATNMTLHGIYLESCTLEQPLIKSKAVSLPKEATISFPAEGEDPPASGEGTLIAPAADKTFQIILPKPDVEYIRSGGFEGNRSMGSATLSYRLLNEQSERQKPLIFALRLK
jgi:hypothetical protein